MFVAMAMMILHCRHSLLRCKHWRRWQLHLRWPGGRDTTLSLLQFRWQSSCNPGWILQSVCCICIFFIQIFVSWRCVLFWLALSWFFLPNFGQYCHSLIITLDESSWFDVMVDVSRCYKIILNVLKVVHCCEVAHTTFSTVNCVIPNGRSVSVDYFLITSHNDGKTISYVWNKVMNSWMYF